MFWNVSSLDREIRTIPLGWHFEAGEKMIYDLDRPSLDSLFKSRKVAIKYNQGAADTKDFV